jgi:hypothetical protein
LKGTDVLEDAAMPTKTERRKSGIPTGNAGEYSVMGDPLRRGFGMIAQVIAVFVSDEIQERKSQLLSSAQFGVSS